MAESPESMSTMIQALTKPLYIMFSAPPHTHTACGHFYLSKVYIFQHAQAAYMSSHFLPLYSFIQLTYLLTFILQQTISAFNTYLCKPLSFLFLNQNVTCIFNKHTMLFLLFYEQNTNYKSQICISNSTLPKRIKQIKLKSKCVYCQLVKALIAVL